MEPVSGSTATTAQRYRAFAEIEAPGQSPLYEEWAMGVAEDPTVIRLIDELPSPKRQAILVFASARASGAPLVEYGKLRPWLVEHWGSVRLVAESRSTQTNEPGRCAVLLPILASLPQPIALLEVGASAGLCLLPDRYSYRYDSVQIDPDNGVSSVVLKPKLSGPVPIPQSMPEIAWRAGIDLNPLDVFDESDATWLETLVWPEHTERLARLRAALAIAREDPPRVVLGDAVDSLASVAAQAPRNATLVVFHSAALAYLTPEHRELFVTEVKKLPGHWISNEGEQIVSGITRPNASNPSNPSKPSTPSKLVLSLDGTAVAYAGGHGQSLEWI